MHTFYLKISLYGLISFSLFSCKSGYGIFVGDGTAHSILKVSRNQTFVWEWNTDRRKNYSDGVWMQKTDSDALWLEAYELLEKDYDSEHQWDSVFKRADELEWIRLKEYKDIQNSLRFHFESNVKDIHKFPMYVEENMTCKCKESTFRFSNLIFFPAAVIVELHLNDTVYPLKSNILRIENHQIDSFRIVMKFTPTSPLQIPYPEQKEVSTITYYPKTGSNRFVIRLYQWELIDRYQVGHPFRVIEYFYYVPIEFDGYFMNEEDLIRAEKLWHINPQTPYPSNSRTKNYIKSFRHLRKRSNIVRERVFVK